MFRLLGIVAWAFLCLGVISGRMSVGCVAVESGAACGVFLHGSH